MEEAETWSQKTNEWEVRQDFVNNETVWRKCSFDFDFDAQGHGVVLECEAVERVKLEEEHRWITLIDGDEGFSMEKAEQEERVRRRRQ